MRTRTVAGLVAVVGVLAGAGAASANPILLPTVSKEIQLQNAQLAKQQADGGIAPPAPGCPENGLLYPDPLPSNPIFNAPWLFSNCGLTEMPPTTMPWGGNMAYWGGGVQVHPKEYLVYWGWGEAGAFPHQTCSAEQITEGSISATLQCDPDGAGKYMADFVHQFGGTDWGKVSTQFSETINGKSDFIQNDKNVLAGIWTDDSNDIAPLAGTNASNSAGPGNTYWDLAEEAIRAAAHFGVTGAALKDANFVIIQPPAYSDPNALNEGYCAFHDLTDPNISGISYYEQLPGNPAPQYLAYSNIPYQLAINIPYLVDNDGTNFLTGSTQEENVCGENSVNAGNAGKLDGFSIVLGHEIEETITDPGAEDLDPASGVEYGGWYDALDASENGDKCAWVGQPLNDVAGVQNLSGEPSTFPVPGATADIIGNAGTKFAVQSLWSNADNQGAGYCAGINGNDSPDPTDSPVPPAAYGDGTASDTPADTSAPTIAGTPVLGQQLSASPGTWANTDAKSAYVYQWQRCDSSGQGCTDIDGATSSTYTPVAEDIGHALSVSVYAANVYGSSPAADSAPSTTVLATAPSTPSAVRVAPSTPSTPSTPAKPATQATGGPSVSGATSGGYEISQPQACPAQTRLKFTLHAPRGQRITKVYVYVNGRLAHFYHGHNLRRISFARPDARAFRLQLVTVLSGHKQRRSGWSYDGCARAALKRA